MQWFRLIVDVSNNASLISSARIDIFPRLVNITIAANGHPSGSSGFITIDGQLITSPLPYTFLAVVGMTRTIAMQANATSALSFISWSDNGAQSHDITIPAVSTTYTLNVLHSSGSTTQPQATPTIPSSKTSAPPTSTIPTSSASITIFSLSMLIVMIFVYFC